MKLRGHIGAFLILSLFIICLSGCKNNEGKLKEAKTQFFAMDTFVTFSATGKDSQQILDESQKLFLEMEQLWSVTEENSDIYHINHADGSEIEVHPQTRNVIEYALQIAEDTNGAIEPTIYPVLTAWGFTTEQTKIPRQEEIDSLLKLVDYTQVSISQNKISVPKGMQIDLGAVGKGYAGDIIAQYLKNKGIASALLDIGGNIQAIGTKEDGNDWILGIRNPFSDAVIGQLRVSNKAVVTSGNYERNFRDENGKMYGHIMNPVTGYPIDNELLSVTIVAEEGKYADALSTAMFVMGKDTAINYWKQNLDYEMILIDQEEQIYITEGLKNNFSLAEAHADIHVNVITKQ